MGRIETEGRRVMGDGGMANILLVEIRSGVKVMDTGLF